ncbi:MAG: hypothetical protein WDA09_06680 [Bacteriovoracaceae bacterium]
MKNFALATLIIFPSAYASTMCPLTDKGEVDLPFGYEITSKKTTKQTDTITIAPSKENPYGGHKQIWKLHKDSLGRIVKIESGLNAPSSQLVQFEIEKRKAEQKHKDAFKSPSYGLVPTLVDLQKLSFDPTLRPIKYGGSIELVHDSGECSVKNITEKVFDPAQKITIENHLYDESFCPKVEKIFSQISRDIQECSDKTDRHNQILAQIRSNNPETMVASSSLSEIDRKTSSLTSGVGGGGGSPAIGRSIASIPNYETSSFNIQAHLMANGESSLSIKDLSKICEARSLTQVRRTSNNDNAPAGGSAKKN